MKEYFRYFKWVYITIAVLLVIFTAVKLKDKLEKHERSNTECTTTQRVFDYADVLSDTEEKELAELIAVREKETKCDIILVTLQQSLKEYAREIEPYVDYDEFVRVYAEQFYETNKFGYDQPNGDGVILVDNWFREDDGKIYTWFCTTGIAKQRYSISATDHLLDEVYRYVEDDPYKAYQAYVNEFYKEMAGGQTGYLDQIPKWGFIFIGFIAAIIYIAVNWNFKGGRKTTNAVTYVNGKNANFVNRQDIFLHKTVTHRRIQTSSGGGGGHSGGGSRSHSGGGGGHHGGGGRSR